MSIQHNLLSATDMHVIGHVGAVEPSENRPGVGWFDTTIGKFKVRSHLSGPYTAENPKWITCSRLEDVAVVQAAIDALISTVNTHVGAGATAHALATGSQHGFIPSTDKSKLDGIDADIK